MNDSQGGAMASGAEVSAKIMLAEANLLIEACRKEAYDARLAAIVVRTEALQLLIKLMDREDLSAAGLLMIRDFVTRRSLEGCHG
jgi:hypothetical protein